MIDINFDGLFSVEVLHKYFTDQLCADFSITPSAKTLTVIAGHKLVVKQYHNKLYAGIRSAAGVPFIPIENGMCMSFYLWLKNPPFVNYTNLPGDYNSSDIFYFTNRNDNAANGKNFLSSAIAGYDSSVSYSPGDLAEDGANTIYRASRSSNTTDQHELSEMGYWTKIDNGRYASANDVLQFMPGQSVYNFSSQQSAANVVVQGYNSAAGNYSSTLLSYTLNFAQPAPSFTLDLSALNTGKYLLTVNGITQWIYINSEINGNKPFGVIDIYNQATPVSCNLVGGGGVLLSPLYTVCFLNRATVWKYILPEGETGLISDGTSTYNFVSVSNSITSTAPIPLSDALTSFKLTTGGNDYSPIPCADAQRLTSLKQAGDTYACSEIYINY